MTVQSDPPEGSTSRLCSTRLPLVSLLVSVGLLMFVTMTIDYAKSGWAVNRGVLDTVVVVIGLLVGVTQASYLMVQYRLWRVVVAEAARLGLRPSITSAARAVGFQFIPVLNLYWVFRVYRGLATDLNAIATARGQEDTVSELSSKLTPVVIVGATVLPVLLALLTSVRAAGPLLLVGALVLIIGPSIFLNDAAAAARELEAS